MASFAYTCMPNSVFFVFFFFVSITINLSTSARNDFSHKTSTSTSSSWSDQTITFLMNDVLAGRRRSPSGPPAGANVEQKPTSGGAYAAQATATFEDEAGSAGNSWLPILTRSPALVAGTVTMIDEELTGNVEAGPPLLGKAQGIYATSAEDNSSHIVAMRVAFAGGESEDSLRLFGVHQPALAESHLAVVGGTGRFEEANGVAILRSVASKTGSPDMEMLHQKVLAVHVYLKW